MPTYDVATYIWPSYTGTEPRTRMFWPEGNGEWETVRKATAKFAGHAWPRKPLWGYCDSWNEWTDGSYLQPDDLHGYGYLDAVKSVFMER